MVAAVTLDNVILFVILGLGTGALIASLSVGLVMIYKGSGVINMATGALAMLGAYCFWAVTGGAMGFTVSDAVGFVITVAFVNVVGLAAELLVFWPLRKSSPVMRLVASLGLLLAAEAAMMIRFGSFTKLEPTILPNSVTRVFSIHVPVAYFILTGFIVVTTGGLTWLYRSSQFGLATRASFENERVAMWIGISPRRTAVLNTLLASTLIGVTSVLVGPVITIDPVNLPLLVVPAVVAAVFANFSSLPIACFAGLALGSAENLIYYFQTQSWYPTSSGVPLPGSWQLLVFIAMVVAVTLRGSRLPTRGEFIERALPAVPEPRAIWRYFWRVLLAGSVALIVLPYDFRDALTNSIVGATLLASLVVITGYVGQISVVQLALSGLSAFVMAHVAQSYDLPFPLAPIIGIAAATLMGIVIGVTTLRVRGIQLAILSLAAASALDGAWFGNTALGAGIQGVPVPDPRVFGQDLASSSSFLGWYRGLPSPVLGISILFCACVICAYVAHLRRTKLGQQMVAVRSNESAAASVGINVRNTKILAFTISSMVAGAAGVMYAYNFRTVSEYPFSVAQGLQVLSLAYIGGITSVSGAALAGLLTVEALIPYAAQKWFGLSGNWALVIGGLGLVVSVVFLPTGVAGAWRRAVGERNRGLLLWKRS